MKQVKLIFEDDFLFHAVSQWKRPQLVISSPMQANNLFQEITQTTKYQNFMLFSSCHFRK